MRRESEKNNHLDLWNRGVAYEVAFWNNLLRWNHFYGSSSNKVDELVEHMELTGFDVDAYLASRESPKVLDVGAGMSYLAGNYIKKDGQKEFVDIQFVDPLAFHYNKILSKYHRKLPTIKFGMVEYLSSYFENGSIDLVIIQNALDHSFDPIKGIRECMITLKIGGVLYLNHHPNEAETERYKGFHQYNISLEDGKLMISDRNNHYDINEMLQPYAEFRSLTDEESGHVINIITKQREVPIEWHKQAEDVANLSKTLARPQSIMQNCKTQLNFYFYNIIQFFVQSLSWENRMRLKRLLKR